MTAELRQPGPDDGVMGRVGRFANRDAWTAEMSCSIERALELVGTRSAVILMREAFLGAHRFEDLARHTGLSDALAAKRLKKLVEGGLLTQRPYREPGSRTRMEYVLTDQGRAFFPVLVAMMRWGDQLENSTAPIELLHSGCGKRLDIAVKCAAGHVVSSEQTDATIRTRPKADSQP
ncbi:MAG TPA: helix-turn-helix domain-containing protein [Trebonia sp.]|nr:helix-turn-helix domain-containing protein [Trebonia sp.]